MNRYNTCTNGVIHSASKMSSECDVFVCFISARISRICLETWMSGQDSSNGAKIRGLERQKTAVMQKQETALSVPTYLFKRSQIMCVCVWMCQWPNGRVASSDTARWWEYKRKVYMTCRIMQYRKNLMDSRVLCWRLVTMTIRHG